MECQVSSHGFNLPYDCCRQRCGGVEDSVRVSGRVELQTVTAVVSRIGRRACFLRRQVTSSERNNGG